MKRVRLSRRPGFETFRMRLLFRFLYPYFYCKCDIPGELAYGEEPVVFVANHYNVFGPVSFILSAPFISYSWMNENLITPEKTEESLYRGVSEMLPYLKEKRIKKICHALRRLVCGVMRRFGNIPVARDDPSKMMQTIRRSIEVLKEGSNVLIFPETGIPEYSLTSVSEFYSGFASLGAFYHMQTGKNLCFCPVYVDELHHIIRSAEPVYYDGESRNIREESDRVSDLIRERIIALAAVSQGAEKQQRAPKRLGILHLCNILRLLAMIPIAFVLPGKPGTWMLIPYLISQGARILFNATRETVPATNHITCLLSHGISILTDILVLLRFRSDFRMLYLLPGLAANCAVFLVSNSWAFMKTGRCAGTNYFDMLTANLFCGLCVLQIAGIRSVMLLMNVLAIVCLAALFFSSAFCIVFNNRIIREKTEKSRPAAE